MSFSLVLGLCVTGLTPLDVKAAGTEIVLENNDDLEQLIMQKNHMKFSLGEMETSPEKEKLQMEYEALCQYLKGRGVNDHITEDLEWSAENGITTYQAPAPDLNTLLGTSFDLDTFYQGVSVDGTIYSFYKVIVTDKAGNREKLSYERPGEVRLAGTIKDENALQRFAVSTVKFVASAVAGITIQDPFIGTAVSTLISAIPNYSPSYILSCGGDILSANKINVEEAVMYIYGYNKEEDRWMHVCSRNSAYVTYNLSLSYYDGFSIDIINQVCHTLVIPDHGGKSNEELAKYMISMIENPTKYKTLDYIGTSFSMSLSSSDKLKVTLSLHGQANPYYMFSN